MKGITMKDYDGTAISPEAARAEIQYLYEKGQEAAEKAADLSKPQSFEAYNKKYIYSNGSLREITPDHMVKPSPFECYSLDGLIKFIQADVDGFFSDKEKTCIVRVSNATEVEVYTPVSGFYMERATLAYTKADTPVVRFGQFMNPEEFQIMLQSNFLPSDNLSLVLKLAGNIKKEQNMQVADDGVSQRVTVNAGVATVTDVTVKNPVELTPIRTFREIEQPESPFVLRFDENGNCALFTGDGAAWRLTAVARIAEYLKNNLAGYNVVVIG